MAGAAETFRPWLDREDLTIEELVEAAEALLPLVAPRQTRYKVRQRPDVRTIRYYISQDLLPKPLGYEGGRARYGTLHLLRLLAVKRMQAEHQSLPRIKTLLSEASIEELRLQLLGGGTSFEPSTPRVTDASPPVTDDTEEDRVVRLELAPGGTVEVPRAVLEDTDLRRQLGQNLEALAKWLQGGAREEKE
jgi:DNA-binding transcriptional MerR regulator